MRKRLAADNEGTTRRGRRRARHGATRRSPASRRLQRGILTAVISALLVAAMAPTASAQDSQGTNFWLGFPTNYQGGAELSLFIAGDTAAAGTVAIPDLSFSEAFTVTPGDVTTVDLPAAMILTSDTVEDLGIRVTSNNPVTVYGLSREVFTTDAYLGLPVDALGTDYINIGWPGGTNGASEFAVVATENATAVTITPSTTAGSHPAGTAYTVNLNQGQTYQLQAGVGDLSGSIITATKPISVYGGHQCANIPDENTFACDHVLEQLPPTTAWGQNFVSMPLATRLNGDTFRVVASQANTTVQLNGATIATLDRGEVHQQIVDGPAQITANNPILVMQYSNGTTFDDVTSDPFQMMIPPFEQFLSRYTVSTPADGFTGNFVNVVAPNAAVGSILLDGTAIPAGEFTAIGTSGFSGAQVDVELGSHTLSGPLPFGVHSYGFASADSYGYPGGLSLSEVAEVTTVALAPKTATNPVGTQHCVTATVKDQGGAPLRDIRVDFAVTGANPKTGFAFTNASGAAQFCYTGANVGSDQIRATVGTISDTAAKTWVAGTGKPGKVSARGTVTAVGGGAVQLSAANDCAPAQSTRGFHVRWTGGGFTKTSVTTSTCTSDTSLPASPAGFNKQVGTAAGTLIGGGAGTVSWTFKDGGPGGVAGDKVSFIVRNAANVIVKQVNEQSAAALSGTPGGVWTFAP